MGFTTQGQRRPCAGPRQLRDAAAIAVARGARRPAQASRARGLPAAVLLAAALSLAGCGANMRAAVGTARTALDGGASRLDAGGPLDPRHEYLRVQIGRQVGLMVRADPAGVRTDRTSYWYSADGALLRLVDGRIVGLADASRSWRITQGVDRIDWAAVAAQGTFEFRRTVDQQPGYRIGQPQQRRLRPAAAAPAGHALQATVAQLQWFVEDDARTGDSLPAWYAVDLAAIPPRVVYGQACLSADWCVNWQPWPPRGRAS